jgi:hypothetical protein
MMTLARASGYLEHGGADIAEVTDTRKTVWACIAGRLSVFYPRRHDEPFVQDVAATSLLRVMVLKGASLADFVSQLRRPEHAQVVEEGACLMAALPAYLVRRRALLDTHRPLIAPLVALVRGYDPEPTTTEELWATGLGVRPASFA